MHHLGSTRSSLKPDHLLQTPDTFVRTPLPGANGVEFVVHVGPQLGAGFAQFTAEFAPSGVLGPTPAQRFLFVLEGELVVECEGESHRRLKRLSISATSLLPSPLVGLPLMGSISWSI